MELLTTQPEAPMCWSCPVVFVCTVHAVISNLNKSLYGTDFALYCSIFIFLLPVTMRHHTFCLFTIQYASDTARKKLTQKNMKTLECYYTGFDVTRNVMYF